jgi:hypothetical protein
MAQKIGTIEAEAEILKKIDEQLKGLSPDVRAEAFQILVQRHLGRPSTGSDGLSIGAKPARSKRSGRPASQLAVVKDLSLKKDGSTPSLRDFYAQKSPKTFSEQNAVFVYYLNRMKDIPGISPSHVFTCYKEVSARVPGAFYQSLVDTARIKGWIDTGDTDHLRITTVGENFVEHDLPRNEG